MEKSFEEILREKMAQPVNVKGSTATMMPLEAMVLSVMNDAMKGNIQAIAFVRSITEGKVTDTEAEREEREQLLNEQVARLQDELEAAKLPTEETEELRLLAVEAITLRRIAQQLLSSTHSDIVNKPSPGGADKQELSITNRLYTDLRKQWSSAWGSYKQGLFNQSLLLSRIIE